MKTFNINYTTKVTNCYPVIKINQNVIIFVKNLDWEIFKREGFKIKSKNLIFPKFWEAVFFANSSDAIYISKRRNGKKLITTRMPSQQKKCWEIVDCCK